MTASDSGDDCQRQNCVQAQVDSSNSSGGGDHGDCASKVVVIRDGKGARQFRFALPVLIYVFLY